MSPLAAPTICTCLIDFLTFVSDTDCSQACLRARSHGRCRHPRGKAGSQPQPHLLPPLLWHLAAGLDRVDPCRPHHPAGCRRRVQWRGYIAPTPPPSISSLLLTLSTQSQSPPTALPTPAPPSRLPSGTTTAPSSPRAPAPPTRPSPSPPPPLTSGGPTARPSTT
jgi:hypothetical protein